MTKTTTQMTTTTTTTTDTKEGLRLLLTAPFLTDKTKHQPGIIVDENCNVITDKLADLNLVKTNNEKIDKLEPVKYGELIVLGYNGAITHPTNPTPNDTNNNSSHVHHHKTEFSSRRKSKFALKRREKHNGVRPEEQINCQNPQEYSNLLKSANHSVTFTLSRNQSVVVQYVSDEKTDMFQIGRSSESAIDFIVLDTQVIHPASSSSSLPPPPPSSTNNNHHPPNSLTSNATDSFPSTSSTSSSSSSSSSQPSSNSLSSTSCSFNSNINVHSSSSLENNPASSSSQNNSTTAQSTISRFSCRILVERDPPHTARIYAAGFDSSKHIFLGEKATKWKNDKSELDGVTTNGVLIMHPPTAFSNTSDASMANEWLEVSVGGAVFSLNDSRLTPCLVKRGENPLKSNILRDGTLIDLCGATLVWRSTNSLQKTPTKHYIEMTLEYLNRLKAQCPVGLKTLLFPSSNNNNPLSPLCPQTKTTTSNPSSTNYQRQLHDRVPMVYLKCGHVHGQHDWGVQKNNNERECPLCRKVGPYVKLIIGLEPSLYCDIVNHNPSSFSSTGCFQFKPFAFRPCGHMASETSCKYWSKIQVPQGSSQGLTSICPFCAVPLCAEQPCVKLIFQESQE